MNDLIPTDDCRGRWADGWYLEEFRGQCWFGAKAPTRLHEETSEYQKISVYESEFFGRFLTLDDLMMLTERDEFVYHEMLVHVPLLSLENPRSVLIIGGGDCGCAREVLKHPSVARVVQVEIDERVTAVTADWFEWVAAVRADSRVELRFEDGVAYIQSQKDAFDLVIVDSTDPIGPAQALFTADFYRSVDRALTPRGILTAQTESPHWSPELVARIFGELRQAFSCVRGFLGTIPTYPSGTWSWGFASNHTEPGDPVDSARAEAISRTCHYYNTDVHRGAFALPTYARRAMEGTPTPDPGPRP